MGKKGSPSYFKKKADVLWSKIIRSRGKCEWCGSEDKQLNAHHIRGRRYSNTRHLISNGLSLCISCHYKSHQDTFAYTSWLLEYKGQEEIERLRRIAEEIVKPDYEKVFNHLKEIWEK